ncbi:MAG: ATPase, T2SS/T4P/T4SS family [Phycisphaerae bacterium]|nr:ATPase, T2SS/T4P/T4SS family [Phycisphaerae bacterium]
MPRSRKKLGQYLIRWGNLTEQQLGEAVKVKEGTSKRLGEVLVDMGYVSEEDVTKALASQYDLEYIDLEAQDVLSQSMIELMPRDIIQKFLVLPLEKNNGRMKVLVHDPMDLDLLDTLRFRLGCEIDVVLGSRGQIRDCVERLMSKTQSSIDETVRALTLDRGESMDRGQSIDQDADDEAEDEDANAPIVRLCNRIIREGVDSRASDIHIEPMADRIRLRYRIDGVCHERDNLPKSMQAAVITRLKIMAGMKVDVRRVPQDGRIKLKVGNAQIDFRVSVCPAYHGESIVLRILRPDAVRVGLTSIGFEPDVFEEFSAAIRRPNGIFLVTGPTGSGKTTTLYSALDTLNRPDKKIITAEDPVEYNFEGINQCQIKEDIGFTFPIVLRSMLRQAPNIVLVGEIRDKEVAEIAIAASLTGHLVFSTLHTNDAPSAITRLIDMGVKPFLVASSIQSVVGQRLIRTLCQECRAPDPSPKPFYMKLVGITPEDVKNHTIYKGVGCAACGDTGYRGRRAIFEYMPMNSELRELAFKRAPASQLRKAAVNAGMRTLVGDGRLKILAGVTTPEEIGRVAQVGGLVEMDEDEG